MLIQDENVTSSRIEVNPQPLVLVAAEDFDFSLSFNIDILNDSNIKSSQKVKISDYINKNITYIRKQSLDELLHLQNKIDRFAESPVYFGNLASLAKLAGELDLERYYLSKAISLSNEMVFYNRLGENLLASGLYDKAEEVFLSSNFDENIHAVLRLAYFEVVRNNLSKAKFYLDKAINLNPIDYGARLLEGVLLLQEGNYIGAIQSFRIALSENSNSSVIHANIAIAYICTGKIDKAIEYLRRSVILNPLNERSLVLLADLSYSEKKEVGVKNALENYLKFDSSNVQIVHRLARCYFDEGQFLHTVSILKGLSKIENSSLISNNIGIAYYNLGPAFRQEAYNYFKDALLANGSEKETLFAARNMCNMYIDAKKYKIVYKYTSEILSRDFELIIASNYPLSDLYIFHVLALTNTNRELMAVDFAERVLKINNISPHLTGWLTSWLISYYSFEGASKSLILADEVMSVVHTFKECLERARFVGLMNNSAFAYIEANMLVKAEKALQFMGDAIHDEAYPTATLGLFHLRSKNLKKGTMLYQESIRIAPMIEKDKIRQKMYYELALYWYPLDKKMARKYIDKAIDISTGVPQVAKQVRKLKASLVGF